MRHSTGSGTRRQQTGVCTSSSSGRGEGEHGGGQSGPDTAEVTTTTTTQLSADHLPAAAPLYLAAGRRVTCSAWPCARCDGAPWQRDSCSSVQLRSAAQQPRRAGLGWHQQCLTSASVRSSSVLDTGRTVTHTNPPWPGTRPGPGRPAWRTRWAPASTCDSRQWPVWAPRSSAQSCAATVQHLCSELLQCCSARPLAHFMTPCQIDWTSHSLRTIAIEVSFILGIPTFFPLYCLQTETDTHTLALHWCNIKHNDLDTINSYTAHPISPEHLPCLLTLHPMSHRWCSSVPIVKRPMQKSSYAMSLFPM